MKPRMKQSVSLLIGIIFGFLVASLFSSCKKEPITPGNYTTTPEPVDTSHWQNGYNNGGSTPTWTTSSNNNDLFGTNWILIEVTTPWPSVTTYPNDTIHFIDNTHYRIGSSTTLFTYNFYPTMANSTLTLNNFIPINSLFFTCNNVTYNSFSNVNVGGVVTLYLKDMNQPSSVYNTIFKKIN